MDGLAAKIRATGRKAGLWLAPLLVVPSSQLYRAHPEWLLRDTSGKLVSAGFNWGEPLYALDLTHPAVLDWLTALMKRVRDWGYDYLKLDFLYAGALPGQRHIDLPRETAYRQGLAVLRQLRLTCGTPILPALGLCDGMRIGPDVAADWEVHRDAVLLYNPTTPSAKNAIRTTINRLWLAPLVQTDPDVAYFRSKACQLKSEQKQMLQDLAQICGFKATSDLPQWWTKSERESTRIWLEKQSKIVRTGRTTFILDDRLVDFSSAEYLSKTPSGFNLIKAKLVSWLSDQKTLLRIYQVSEIRKSEVFKKSIVKKYHKT